MMCFIGYSLCYISRLPICQSIENNVNIQFMLNHYNHVVGSHLNEHVINSFSYCLFFVWTSGFLIKSTYAIHSRFLFSCNKIHLFIVWRKILKGQLLIDFAFRLGYIIEIAYKIQCNSCNMRVIKLVRGNKISNPLTYLPHRQNSSKCGITKNKHELKYKVIA